MNTQNKTRREFLKSVGLGTAALAVTGCANTGQAQRPVPPYLKEYDRIYEKDPRQSALKWFRNAKFGLFMHYGIYSLMGQGEWVQYRKKIPVAEYAKLKGKFTAKNFDADFITELAIEAEMKYVNITTKHHDGFCLFRTRQTDFNSVNSPAKRDLVEELANACAKKNLGLCFYYSHGREWKHPHAPNNDKWKSARPAYDPAEPSYLYGQEHDLNKYVDFMHAQLTELLTQYGPVANIWLDGWSTPMSGAIEKFRIPETYALIRKLQPQTLISAKLGYNGDEDFYAPEYHWPKRFPDKMKEAAKTGKPIEICHHIAGWGYNRGNDGKHRGVDSVIENLKYAAKFDANLLLNTAPLPDGSIDRQDMRTLREVGRRIRKTGWPTAG